MIDKTAEFVARNGVAFEAKIREQERLNPKFAFLQADDAYNSYFRMQIRAAAERSHGDTRAAASSERAASAVQAALLAREVSFAELLAQRGMTLRTDLLQAQDHWITPEFEPRRYDTWFFAALMPADQHADDDTTESDVSRWVRPAQLLADLRALLADAPEPAAEEEGGPAAPDADGAGEAEETESPRTALYVRRRRAPALGFWVLLSFLVPGILALLSVPLFGFGDLRGVVNFVLLAMVVIGLPLAAIASFVDARRHRREDRRRG